MVGSDCAPFHWEGLSQEWWIPQNNILMMVNDGNIPSIYGNIYHHDGKQYTPNIF